ncbi:hypothetical protein QZH41_013026, partial [Actinostola sp. cb2023]
HYLTMFGSTVTIPFILAGPMCFKDNPVAISEVLSTIFFVSGLCTLLQTTFGTRLPIVQGGSFSFIGPAIAILNLEKWKCPSAAGGSTTNSSLVNASQNSYDPNIWNSRMNEWFNRPSTEIYWTADHSSYCHNDRSVTISTSCQFFRTMILVIAFSQYLKDVHVPVFVYQRNSGFSKRKFKPFRLFPVSIEKNYRRKN